MRLPESDAEVAAWVSAAIAALDDTPRYRMWKQKALGMPRTVALATAPRDYRLDLRIPVTEMRVVNEVAQSRSLGARAYLRRALGTVMVACDGVDPALLPHLTRDGLIGPP